MNNTIDVHITDPKNGVNAFWMAAFAGSIELMAILAEQYSINIHSTNHTGSTALHLAVKKNYYNVCKELITKYKFPLEANKRSGLTPLGLAVQTDNYPIIKLLCDAGADVNSTNVEGESLLYISIRD